MSLVVLSRQHAQLSSNIVSNASSCLGEEASLFLPQRLIDDEPAGALQCVCPVLDNAEGLVTVCCGTAKSQSRADLAMVMPPAEAKSTAPSQIISRSVNYVPAADSRLCALDFLTWHLT